MEEKGDNGADNGIIITQQTVDEVLTVKPIEHALLLTLSIINALCYMDRYLFGALLLLIKDYFELEYAIAGLLYASFAITYALFYPLVIYLAQYYKHRHFLRNSCLLWMAFTAMTAVCRNVYVFAYMRLLVAACQATFAAIALQVVTKIAGRYPKQGAIWLHIYQIMGPFGVGFGFASAAILLQNDLKWHYCYCVVPVLLLVNLPMLYIARVRENPNPLLSSIISDHLTWKTSLIYEIYMIPTELLSTFGSICAVFSSSAVYLWLPLCVQFHYKDLALNEILWCLAGVFTAASWAGMVLGIILSRILYKFSKSVDSLLSGFSVFTALLFMAIALYYLSSNLILTLVLFTTSQLIFFVHTPLTNELLMYVVPPPKRIFASTLQIVFVNLCGDAASAILVGMLASWLGSSALPQALSYIVVIQVFAALCYFWSALFVRRDRERVRQAYPVRERSLQPRYKRAFITVRSLSEIQ